MDRGEPRGARICALAVLTTLTAALAWSLALPEQNPAARTAMETANRNRCLAFVAGKVDQARAQGDAELAEALEENLNAMRAVDDTTPARRLAAR